MSTLIQKQIAKVLWLLAALLLTTAQVQAETYYFHNDQLGTPQVVTDTTQQVVWKGEYDPFGGCTEVVNLVQQNIRFPGQYFDVETGLHYNMQRTYDPNTGRYVESDPIGMAGGINTYGYAYQNSIRYTDPTGEFVPVAVWYALLAAFEVAGSVYDVVGAVSTFADECASGTEKAIAGGIALAGIFLPGGGFSGTLKHVTKKVPTDPPVQQMNPKNLIPTQTKNEISGSQVKRLKKDMQKNGFDQSEPIDVVKNARGRLEIEDGHHRTEAAIKAGLDKVPVRVWE